MIKLTKGILPISLKSNGDKWKSALMNFIKDNPVETKVPNRLTKHYNKPDIKASVTSETYGKCMYCESKVTHQYPGDIEHIIPKSICPMSTFTWQNLSFACWWCNHHKLDFFDKKCKLLNPYKDNINEHIRTFGPMVMQVVGSKRGEITIKRIKLNRSDLLEKRRDQLDQLQNLIDKYHNESNISLKNILYDELIENIGIDKEYSLYKKQFLIDHGINN